MEDSWLFLREFCWTEPGAQLSWDEANAFSSALAQLNAPLRARLEAALRPLDEHLEKFGGDPLREDWSRFRPMRLDREEDWSDWLAWLIETSRSGEFAGLVFDRDADSCHANGVDREFPVGRGSYRLDLRIRWTNGDITTVEVKVGDQNFEKTEWATDVHREEHGDPCRGDWILLPPEDESRCVLKSVRRTTWDHVARSLRTCLSGEQENLAWRAWARSFVGCIEQRLLGFSTVVHGDIIHDSLTILRHLENKR